MNHWHSYTPSIKCTQQTQYIVTFDLMYRYFPRRIYNLTQKTKRRQCCSLRMRQSDTSLLWVTNAWHSNAIYTFLKLLPRGRSAKRQPQKLALQPRTLHRSQNRLYLGQFLT